VQSVLRYLMLLQHIEVLEPMSLRNEIEAHVARMFSSYNGES
jgi:hypothetical protein